MSDQENPASKAVEFRRRAADIRAMVKDFLTPEVREGLLKIAEDWERLAQGAERDAARGS